MARSRRAFVLGVLPAVALGTAGCQDGGNGNGDDGNGDADGGEGGATDGGTPADGGTGTAEPTGTSNPDSTSPTGGTGTVEVGSQAGLNVQSGTVPTVQLTVKLAAGSADVDLTGLVVQWVGPRGAFDVVHESASGGGDGQFTTSVLKDVNGSHPVLTKAEDRFMLTMEPETFTGSPLQEGETVDLTLTTAGGSQTSTRLSVPASLTGQDSVTL